jgi:hypothetical protein
MIGSSSFVISIKFGLFDYPFAELADATVILIAQKKNGQGFELILSSYCRVGISLCRQVLPNCRGTTLTKTISPVNTRFSNIRKSMKDLAA